MPSDSQICTEGPGYAGSSGMCSESFGPARSLCVAQKPENTGSPGWVCMCVHVCIYINTLSA